MNKKNAFTLAEVLITLSIIGVISALTVPTLVNDYQRKTNVIQLRKVVNDIYNAADMLITEEGKSKFSATTGYNNLDEFATKRLKVLKTCSSTNTNECFASENYTPIDGGTGETFSCAGNSYILASSSAICMTKDTNGSILVNIDINGAEGPNIGGRDMFVFYIRKDGETSPCSSGTCSPSVSTCKGSSKGEDCYGVLAEANWEMNY